MASRLRIARLAPQNAEVTIQPAANFPNVSRPFLTQLQEEKKMPSRKVTRTGAPVFEDVLRYKELIDAERRKTL